MPHLLFRTLTGTFLLIIFGLAIWFSDGPLSFLFPLLSAGVVSFALNELYTLCAAKGYPSLRYLAIGTTFLYYLTIDLNLPPPFSAFILLLTLFLGFCYYFYNCDKPLLSLSMTLFGICYLTLPLSALLYLARMENGKLWLLYLLLMKVATDGGGYLFGSLLGKRPLAPSISPHKTWEGAIFGITLACVLTLTLHSLLAPPLTLSHATLLALLLAFLIITGDLAESLIKRDIGVKDSAHIPGVGGVLDTIDSLVFATPFLYFFLKAVEVPL